MDRASDSGSEGWGFESLPVYQINKRDTRMGIPLIYFELRAGRDSKGRHQCAHWCIQQSGGLLNSPWESPWIWERNPEDCEAISIISGAKKYRRRRLDGAEPLFCSCGAKCKRVPSGVPQRSCTSEQPPKAALSESQSLPVYRR